MKSVLLAALLVLTLCKPQLSANSAGEALSLWSRSIVPSLFPYMVLCQSLVSLLSARTGMPLALCVLLGLAGGSPSGAAALSCAGESSRISSRRAFTLTALCGTISPMFFLQTVPQWMGSEDFSLLLMISHFAGAGLSACAAAPLANLLIPQHSLPQQNLPDKSDTMILPPLSRSIRSILHVGGCIVVCSTTAALLSSLLPISDGAKALLHSALEISGGMHALALLPAPLASKALLCAGAAGFGGFSILMQNKLFLERFGLSLRHLILVSLLRSACCMLVMLLLMTVLP